MGEVIDPTLVVFHAEDGEAERLAEPGLRRVAAHYQDLAHEPLERRGWVGARAGIACFTDPAFRCGWPAYSEDGGRALACGYVPVGWERLVGERPPEPAARALASELLRRPERVALELNSPVVLALADAGDERVVLLNDRLGAGRLYELAFPGGRVWSNRVGALALFSGAEVRPSEKGWALFAANGWFMRETTPLEGATKVPPASIIEIGQAGVSRRREAAAASVIEGSGDPLGAGADRVARQAVETMRAAGALHSEPARIDLSGGRDSRVSAAAAIVAGIPAEFRTSDVNPGEADIARELIALAPGTHRHRIAYSGGEVKQRGTELRRRALNAFLLHDGMRHAGKVRGRLQLPPPPARRAAISGHGGEIGHGFYYTNPKKLREAREGGFDGMVERLLTSCRRTHSAAQPHAYELARAEFEATLREGMEAGITGPALLDWYYLMDRFAHRSGLASHTQRVTVFSTPAFLEAAFALTPEQRLDAALHREVTARLIPGWADVPYFRAKRGRRPAIRRRRIWEGPDGRSLRRMLRAEDCWHEIFDPKRARRLLRRARLGRGRGEWEHVFERITYRVAFEDWAALIRRHQRV